LSAGRKAPRLRVSSIPSAGRRAPRLRVLALLLALLAAACGRSGSPPAPGLGEPAARGDVALNKEAYPVFPDADAGADPAVPAEQGGRGFTGDGWETSTDYDLIGDPRAVKGGVFREWELDFPGTMRIYGPETYAFNHGVMRLVYESLLDLHPTTLSFIPSIATHWQISPDRQTYRFRINPNARFADGQPVTAADVVASWKLVMDKGLQEPNYRIMLERLSEPVADSRYLVTVRSRELNWQNFLNFAWEMPILPAHALKGVDGAAYLRDYNFKMLPGSGPYAIREADVVKGQSVTLRRRPDYWAGAHRRNVGAFNFDEIRHIVVRDRNLALEMFKRGDFDYFYANVSREWVEDFAPEKLDPVRRGLILRRRIFNHAPRGIQGLAINMRRAPLDDLRVRQALALLMNRKLLIQKLFYNEYVPLNSYHPGGQYTNPDNPANPYDPGRATALLAEAGWSSRDNQGRLVRNGRPLMVELLYADQGSERWLTVYQDDLRRAGVTLNLRLVTYETLLQLTGEHNFDLATMAWIASTFPDPQQQWRASQADAKHSFNITGFKDSEVDRLMDRYYTEFDQEARAAIIREIDGRIAQQYPYVLEWDMPFRRVLVWNRLGMPQGGFTRTREYYQDIQALWWVDPIGDARLREAMGSSSIALDPGGEAVRYWDEYVKQHGLSMAPPQ
jgi:microcin C transport system substrate-binding protein